MKDFPKVTQLVSKWVTEPPEPANQTPYSMSLKIQDSWLGTGCRSPLPGMESPLWCDSEVGPGGPSSLRDPLAAGSPLGRLQLTLPPHGTFTPVPRALLLWEGEVADIGTALGASPPNILVYDIDLSTLTSHGVWCPCGPGGSNCASRDGEVGCSFLG